MKRMGWGVIATAIVVVSVLTLSALSLRGQRWDGRVKVQMGQGRSPAPSA